MPPLGTESMTPAYSVQLVSRASHWATRGPLEQRFTSTFKPITPSLFIHFPRMTRLPSTCRNKIPSSIFIFRYRFPSNSKERAAWLKAVGKPNLRINTNTSVCSKHFKPEDFWPRYASGVVTLRPNAIPTLMMESENSSDAPGVSTISRYHAVLPW